MAKPQLKRPSGADFARSSSLRDNRRRCLTCKSFPDVVRFAREAMQVWAHEDEAGDVHFAGLYEAARRAFPTYPLGGTAFRKHLVSCERDLYEAIKDRGRL